MLTTCLRPHISQICAKKFQNRVHLCFGKVLKLRVTKGELIISNRLEMADNFLLPAGGGGAPPPCLDFLVNFLFFTQFLSNFYKKMMYDIIKNSWVPWNPC